MPTPPPAPIKSPNDDTERLAREGAVNFVKELCERLDSTAYGTRSHMPANLDFTDFSNALQDVVKFCEARPDWTLRILKPLLERK